MEMAEYCNSREIFFYFQHHEDTRSAEKIREERRPGGQIKEGDMPVFTKKKTFCQG
jgi:hypothetical protein